jgi:hypothetical protein
VLNFTPRRGQNSYYYYHYSSQRDGEPAAPTVDAPARPTTRRPAKTTVIT